MFSKCLGDTLGKATSCKAAHLAGVKVSTASAFGRDAMFAQWIRVLRHCCGLSAATTAHAQSQVHSVRRCRVAAQAVACRGLWTVGLSVIWAAAPIVLTPAAAAFTITLNSGGTSELLTRGNDRVGARVDEFVYPTALSYSYTSTSVDGGSSSQSVYDLSDSAFNITFDQSRTTAEFSEGRSWGYIYFTVDQDVYYSAAGAYSAIDPDGLLLSQTAWLSDVGTGFDVFKFSQGSDSTPNESFLLGAAGGDSSNVGLGSLSGTLTAGHDYRFWYDSYVSAWPSSSWTNATSSGYVSLSFTPIPEPSSALLVSLGLSGFALLRRAS
jgi:hypothetical protein